MIRVKDVIPIESGNWESPYEVVSRVIETLKDNNMYNPDQIYRIQRSSSEKSISGQIIRHAGLINKESNLGPNQFYGCAESDLAHYYYTLDANIDPYCYIIGYNPNKVKEVLCSVFEFKEAKRKKDSLDFIIEVQND
jgi:hypothetical protein